MLRMVSNFGDEKAIYYVQTVKSVELHHKFITRNLKCNWYHPLVKLLNWEIVFIKLSPAICCQAEISVMLRENQSSPPLLQLRATHIL